MKIRLTSIPVDDQDKALKFYTEILGIPLTSFMVADITKDHERLTKLGVTFPTKPTKAGPTTIAVLDDTCGNLIQLFQP